MDSVKKDRERFVAFSFATAEIFFEISIKGKILYEGGAYARLLPGASRSLVGMNFVDLLVPEDQPFFEIVLPNLLKKQRFGPIPLKFPGQSKQGFNTRAFGLYMGEDVAYLALRTALLSNDHGVSDDQINLDTRLISREGFVKMVARAIKGQSDSQGQKVQMSMMHLEGLEEIRQQYGVQEAHDLIFRMAAHLRTLSMDGSMAGHLAENDFAILHQGNSAEADIQAAIKEVDTSNLLKATVKTVVADQKDTISEQQIIQTLSYVFSTFAKDPEGLNLESLADMYDDVVAKAIKRMTAIEGMIENQSFKINYQPIFSLETGEISHHEILSRFDEIIEGETPADLIQFAEDVGMIADLDMAVFHKAFDSIASYKKLGNTLKLAVNLSGRTLSSEKHMNKLLDLLRENQHCAGQLMIELTESSTVRDLDRSAALFNAIKDLGFSISIDDFGQGTSGLNYLRVFDVDYVKIDGAFIRDLSHEEPRPGLLLKIVRMCKDLGVKIIAEQVEEQYQAEILKSLGVDQAQGYYYSRPQPAPIFRDQN